jgi:hypothetical protein
MVPLQLQVTAFYNVTKTLLITTESNCNGWCGGGVRGPWRNGGHLEVGEVGGPGPPGGGKGRTVGIQTVEEGRRYKMPQNTGDGLATTPSHVYAQSMYHCALCINFHIDNHNRNHVLLYYLFQENKSFGSKKPFTVVLWCTRSCVEHSNQFCNFVTE